jgi:hypothetical protein
MVVRADRRGAGAGLALIEAAIEFAREQKCPRITLLTDEDNAQAQWFYGRTGFCRSAMVPMRLEGCLKAANLIQRVAIVGTTGSGKNSLTRGNSFSMVQASTYSTVPGPRWPGSASSTSHHSRSFTEGVGASRRASGSPVGLRTQGDAELAGRADGALGDQGLLAGRASGVLNADRAGRRGLGWCLGTWRSTSPPHSFASSPSIAISALVTVSPPPSNVSPAPETSGTGVSGKRPSASFS